MIMVFAYLLQIALSPIVTLILNIWTIGVLDETSQFLSTC